MKLLLVDGYSLLYRAYFSSPPFSTRAGEPTGALYGFVRMVTRLLDENQPDSVVVALDPPGGTFRHESDATYKANRAETPDDLKIQQTLVRELLDGLSIPRYEHEGFEADDVIGTLSMRGEEHGQTVLIITGDGDQLQLATENVKVFLTRKGVTELEGYGPAEVVARFGFEPKFIPDFKGLKGDASDNIPGVPGIGDKTASSLLQKFGSLEGVYEKLEEVTPVRIRELLRTYRDQAFHSKELATIVCDLKVERQPEEFVYDPINPEKRKKAAETARRFEFKSLAARYETPLEAAVAAAAVVPPKALEVELEVTDSRQGVQNWLDARGMGALIGFSLSEEGAVLGQEGKALLFTGALAELKDWMEDENSPKIAHDAKAILRRLQPSNLKVRGIRGDTMLMSYLVDPTRQNHDIDFVAQKFLSYILPPAPVVKKKPKTASLFEEDNVPDEEEIKVRRTYEAAITAILVELEPVLRHELSEFGHESIFDDIEMPLVPVLAQVECCGMQINPDHLRRLGTQLETEAARLQKAVWEGAGQEFNIGSPKQLGEVLFEKMGLASGRKTKSGSYSTDVFTLEKLAEENETVRNILKYRGITKLKSTYVDALLEAMDPQTHRVHSTLNQTGAVSGRLSSTNPNLQNVPIRTEQGRQIRKAFVAPPGHVLLSVDYSQIELRILAHITGDAPLVDAFATGEDVHTRTAAALFGVEASAVDREMRRKAKMTNYAIAYGVSAFGLAKQLGPGTTGGEAQEFITRYFETLPGVKKYIDDTLIEARKVGYVETLAGRKRPIPDITANAFQVRSAAERTAINHPIQGTAADMMKYAMLAIERELEDRKLKTSMTMQVHDELVFEVPENELAEVKELVVRLMCEVPEAKFNLKVPLVADAGVGKDWDSTKGEESSEPIVFEEVTA